MAQSALTVTAPNPTPPTNMSFTGTTAPNPPNYTKVSYAEPYGARNAAGYPIIVSPPGVCVNVNPPPFYDDGTAGSIIVFAATTSALASGTGATSGGTEGTYPGTGTGVSMGGAVPASTSFTHEGAGTEIAVTAPGSSVIAGAETKAVSCGPVMNTQPLRDAGPNAAHASNLSGTATPTLTGATGANNVSGVGTTVLTATGTNYNRASVVNISGIPQTTQYVSATSLTVTNAVKRTTAGTLPVTVTSNGQTTAPQNWTLT